MTDQDYDNTSLARELIEEHSIAIPISLRTGITGREMEVAGIKEIKLPYSLVEESLEAIGKESTSDVMAYVTEHANALSAWETEVDMQESLLFNFTGGLVSLINSDSHFSRTPQEIVGEPITRSAVYEVSSLGSYESALPEIDKAKVKELADAEQSERVANALDVGSRYGWNALELELKRSKK